MLLEIGITANVALTAYVVHLLKKLKQHEICPVFNTLSRVGLEDKWKSVRKTKNLAIAFLDVDKLKQANERLGQYECSKRLAESFALARQDEIIGRFYSGDELIILAPTSDIHKPINRIMSALKEREMSATVVVAPYRGEETLHDAVKEANDKVQELKSQDVRGIVFEISQ